MKKFKYLIIVVFLAISGCEAQNNKMPDPGPNVLLYGHNWSLKSRELIVIDIENSYKYNIPEPEELNDYKFFNSNRTILISYLKGQYGTLDSYDYITGKSTQYQISGNQKRRTSDFTNYKDSLMIYSTFSDVYFETLAGDEIDSIRLDAYMVLTIIPNNNCIIALNYTNNARLKFASEPTELVFVDLKSKKRLKPEYRPFMVEDWAPDGKSLLVRDSVYRILSYPDFKLKPVDGLNNLDSLVTQDRPKYLNDSLLVFGGKTKGAVEQQLYLYNLNQDRIIKKLTSGSGSKVLFDVFSQRLKPEVKLSK